MAVGEESDERAVGHRVTVPGLSRKTKKNVTKERERERESDRLTPLTDRVRDGRRNPW